MTKGNGSGNGHDDEQRARDGRDFRTYMSQIRQPSTDTGDEPPRDPREATDFRAVWDKLATTDATRHLIDYINGGAVVPAPTLTEIVRAFFAEEDGKAIFPEQISMVIALCGGQLSRRHGLRADVLAEWGKARQDQIDGVTDAQQARQGGVPQAQSVPVFLKGSLQPSYLIEPILQRATLYTCTALTSHGKTAVLLYIALCIASGRRVADNYTVPGRVVWLAGENPDDFAMKIATACDHWNMDPADLDMVVIPGAFDLADKMEDAVKMAAAGGDVALVVVDTSAAYRFDDDEDSNPNSIDWARTMRRFVRMPGRPAVVMATHPTKHAEATNLLPRGGGGFLNEVDGNLSLWADEDQATTTLSWQGKWRGMTFAPIAFDLRPCPHPTWKLRNGEPVTIKLAIPTGEEAPRRQPQAARKGAPDRQRLARNILADLLVIEGKAGHAPNGLMAVEEEKWRSAFYSRACVEDDLPNTKRVTYRRTAGRMLEAQTIGINDGWVWLTQPEAV